MVSALLVARPTYSGWPLHGHEWLALTLVAACFMVALLGYVLVCAAVVGRVA